MVMLAHDSYSNTIGSGPAIFVELEAIKYGLDWFFSLRELHSCRLILESDCSTALDWISNPTLCPPAFRSLVNRCKAMIDANGVITRLISRSINVEANSLAKEGGVEGVGTGSFFSGNAWSEEYLGCVIWCCCSRGFHQLLVLCY
ncbi:hypothetical protein V6N11_002042 [Hibiscus sabdariffa]|uniref:RNase H type-1 domain-containing protein n=1 Tax=Hibiscus sabdariffa TaxID=183260 RepID=A0ABR2QUM5_9ROSI